MRRSIIIFMILILLLGGSLSSPIGSSEEYQITVLRIEGKVEKRVSEKLFGFLPVSVWKPLREGDSLKPGDKVKTGTDSVVEIYFANQTYLRFEESTVAEIGENRRTPQGTASSLKLKEGGVWVRVKEIWRDITKFEVITPTAVAGVKGTVFNVDTEEDLTQLIVKEGVVELSNKDRRERVKVRNNQMSKVIDKKVENPQSVPAHVKEKWKEKEIKKWLNETKKEKPPQAGPKNKSDKENGKDDKNNGKDKAGDDKGNPPSNPGKSQNVDKPDNPDEAPPDETPAGDENDVNQANNPPGKN